jgi:hypothetical protein
MKGHKMPLSFCVGEFYLVGNIDIDCLKIEKGGKEYNISFKIQERDIKRIDDEKLKETSHQASSNIIQINFETGERKWV